MIDSADYWQYCALCYLFLCISNGVFMKKRFLRDGILDEMIENLKQLEIANWQRNERKHIMLSSIVNLFEGNRRTLKKVEKCLEQWKEKDLLVYQDFVKVADLIQTDLINTYEEIHEIKKQ